VRNLTVHECDEFAEGTAIVSDSSLAKLVATFVILIGLAFWLKAERNNLLGCHINCPTDFSAISKGER